MHIMSDTIRNAFRLPAENCRMAGSELTARVLDALHATLDHSTLTGARILDWPGDPMTDALAHPHGAHVN